MSLAATMAVSSATLAEERKGSWELGLFTGVTAYAGEFQLTNEQHFGVRFGYNFQPSYEIELQAVGTGSASMKEPDSTLLNGLIPYLDDPERQFSSRAYSVRFLINPRNERRRLKPYVAFGAGVINFTPSPALDSADEGNGIHAKLITVGGGLRMRFTPHMSGRVELEAEYAPTDIYTNTLLNVGVTWVIGGGSPKDTDGDGVLDLHDQCPDTPAGALVDRHNGCPWDTDLDGIMEGIDKCADTPKGWPVDAAGCPLDTDVDGVPDGADKCADTPKGAIVDEAGCPLDADGDSVPDGIDLCPDTPRDPRTKKSAIVDGLDGANPGCPHDSDKDGIPDGIDDCPLTAPGATVDPIDGEKPGCPRDTDGDKVWDGIDQCPDTPKGQKIDREGCPRVRLDKPEPQILQNVKFLQGTELYPGTDAWLELAVDALSYWSDLNIEIGGYTDKDGSASSNKLISQRRAEVIKAWLVNHGIDAKRLTVKGYGAVNFIAENDTEEGKDKNRRIELKRVSGDPRRHPRPTPEAPAPAETEPGAAPAAPEAPPAAAPAATPSAPAATPSAPAPTATPEPSPTPDPPSGK